MQINYIQVKKFLLSGGSATAVHFSVMAVFIYFGLDSFYATIIGSISGAIFNYVLQYFYTFNSDKSHFKSIATYSIAVFLSFLSNAYLFSLFNYDLKMGIIFSQLVTTSIVTLQNYIVYKYFVFLKGSQ